MEASPEASQKMVKKWFRQSKGLDVCSAQMSSPFGLFEYDFIKISPGEIRSKGFPRMRRCLFT